MCNTSILSLCGGGRGKLCHGVSWATSCLALFYLVITFQPFSCWLGFIAIFADKNDFYSGKKFWWSKVNIDEKSLRIFFWHNIYFFLHKRIAYCTWCNLLTLWLEYFMHVCIAIKYTIVWIEYENGVCWAGGGGVSCTYPASCFVFTNFLESNISILVLH